MNFEKSAILMSMDLLVGLPNDRSCDRRRLATLKLIRPYLFYVEPPGAEHGFVGGTPLNVQGDSLEPGQNAVVDSFLPSIPDASTKYRFFVEDWNSFVYIACEAVEFAWSD